MAHAFNASMTSTDSSSTRDRRALPEPSRSIASPLFHAWRRLRARLQIRERQKIESKDRRALLDGSTPIIQDVYGYRFVVYSHHRSNVLDLARHPTDRAEFEVIPRLVRRGDIAFDVGANVGLYSVLLSRLCGPRGRVWAFEPVPETYWRLRETLALNRCENVAPVQAAVCDKDGMATMSLFDPGHAEWNTLGTPEVDPCGNQVQTLVSVQVASRSLDEFCKNQKIDHINFLKVDVEGFEVSVFAGADKLLRDHRVDFLCFEISQRPLRSAGFSSRDVFAALEAHGYAAYALDRVNGMFRGPVHDTQEQWTNFFASPNDLRKI
ncbi:MAG: FkbM family methyltransferase [Candidatus Acidiferrales bacterium]